jgi:3-oxoadipate enol-lactonase
MSRTPLARHWDRSTGVPRGVVVFLGSLGSDHTMWNSQVPTFLPEFDVLRLEHPGHGGSLSHPGPYTLDGLTRDVIEVLDAERVESANIVGLSLGGMIAMNLALLAPERVERLSVLCTSGQLGPAQNWIARAQTVSEHGPGAIAEDVVSRWFTPEFAALNPASVKRMTTMIGATDAQGYAGCCHAIAGMNLLPALNRLQHPLLAIAGDRDQTTPQRHLEEIANRAPNAQLAVIPGAHLANVENPGAVNELIGRHLGLEQYSPVSVNKPS